MVRGMIRFVLRRPLKEAFWRWRLWRRSWARCKCGRKVNAYQVGVISTSLQRGTLWVACPECAEPMRRYDTLMSSREGTMQEMVDDYNAVEDDLSATQPTTDGDER